MANPTESEEQIALFRWASTFPIPQGRLGHYMFSVPNEAARSPKHGARMKAQGLRSGVPDICLALPVGGMPGMYIEMKRGSGGKVSENQQKWIDRLRSVGYVVEVCYGAEEAKEAINNYLNSAS